MEMSGARQLNVPQLKVWAALNDPEMLRACIPGCDRFVPAGEHEYSVALTASVGPVKAHFTGKVKLFDIRPAEGYTMRFEGQGGAAGFAKGDAVVALEPDGDGTRLAYQVKAHVGGRLAQVGSRLVDGAAKKLADEFFAEFAQRLEPTSSEPAIKEMAMDTKVPIHRRIPMWAWVLIVLVLAGIALYAW